MKKIMKKCDDDTQTSATYRSVFNTLSDDSTNVGNVRLSSKEKKFIKKIQNSGK